MLWKSVVSVYLTMLVRSMLSLRDRKHLIPVKQLAVTNSRGQKAQFWGFDHIGQVACHLDLETPFQDGWRAML